MTFIKSHYFLWVLLALPLAGILPEILTMEWNRETYKSLMHITGETSARLLIITLMISPLKELLRNNKFVRWLRRKRRYFGVFSFIYAMIHLLVYLFHLEIDQILGELQDLNTIAGWIALLILVPLAATSFNIAIKWLGGKQWKNLHRMTYVAAICTLLHWALQSGDSTAKSVVHFAPLIILEALRVLVLLKNQNHIHHAKV